jgi:hypothetical protein
MSHDKDDDQPVDVRMRNEIPVRPLRGFATLLCDADEVLVRVRARQADLARKKRAELLRESEDSDL